MANGDLAARATAAVREARRSAILASCSIACAVLALASVFGVAFLSFAQWPPFAWLGPLVALGGLSSWATGVACGGIALGSSYGRRAAVGLAMCALAAVCFVGMVLALSVG